MAETERNARAGQRRRGTPMPYYGHGTRTGPDGTVRCRMIPYLFVARDVVRPSFFFFDRKATSVLPPILKLSRI